MPAPRQMIPSAAPKRLDDCVVLDTDGDGSLSVVNQAIASAPTHTTATASAKIHSQRGHGWRAARAARAI